MFFNVLNLSFHNTAACPIFKSFCFSSKIYIFYSLTFFVSVIDKGFQARMRKWKRNNTVTKIESFFVDLCEFRFLCNNFFYTTTAPYDTESMLFLFFNFFFSKFFNIIERIYSAGKIVRILYLVILFFTPLCFLLDFSFSKYLKYSFRLTVTTI